MEIKKEYDFEDLKKECWSGAIKTLRIIEENNKEELFMDILEDFFIEMPTMTEVNDLLWFNDDDIFEALGIEIEED